MVILITNGVGERDLGLVMVFCHPNQAKMETCDILSALHQQQHSSEPSMVAVGRYSDTPYIPWGIIHSLYLDMGTFSGGFTLAQFPLDKLHLWWLLPISRTGVFLPCKVGEEGLEIYLHLPDFLWDGLGEEHHLFNPIPLSVTPLTTPSQLEENTQTRKGSGCHPTSTQMEAGQGTTHASNSYRTTTRSELK